MRLHMPHFTCLTPLASNRWRRQCIWVLKTIFDKQLYWGLSALICVTLVVWLPSYATAQVAPPRDRIELPPPEPVTPQLETPREEKPDEGEDKADTSGNDIQAFTAPDIPEKPDYSRISENAERDARLEILFERLKKAQDEEAAELIAEDIWALWLESGSASVNLVLRRGADAQKKKNIKVARRLYDETTKLRPEFAEGWARSSRLALEENNLSRALNEAAKTLVLEPRHFYALWTMGNVFEQLGRGNEALESYREANKLHPQLKAVKDRLSELESDINGDVL